MRGVGAELEGGLEGGGSEIGEEVANLLLAGVDDGTGGRVVDGGGNIVTELLKTGLELFEEIVSGEERFGGHGLLPGKQEKPHRARAAVPSFPIRVGAPERFATPKVGHRGDFSGLVRGNRLISVVA